MLKLAIAPAGAWCSGPTDLRTAAAAALYVAWRLVLPRAHSYVGMMSALPVIATAMTPRQAAEQGLHVCIHCPRCEELCCLQGETFGEAADTAFQTVWQARLLRCSECGAEADVLLVIRRYVGLLVIRRYVGAALELLRLTEHDRG